ncbi:shikimate kinase [Legionella lansingensis]|uniref:Shikimate kinase n=1 Tax=Legionella lansingensis TaxID=45067 RepID=A0A0W0VKJ7_9GAMM|nr:shikimate kinase [Legionella lansingensis]KTD20595.1 shikimate kinase [Legionella lansingensis]SNV46290.1 shikimate kinase [Legionella lansingensis]
MSQPKRIFIIGHSGAGKAVLAEALAKKLSWKYVNADFALEPSIGRTMTEILGNHGREEFHRCLSAILSYQITQKNIVVATDDSIVCDERNRKLLSSEFTIHLKVSIPVQMGRISYNRPLLPLDNYKGFLEQLRHERDALYEQVASFSLSSDSGTIEEHVLSVVKALGEATPT